MIRQSALTLAITTFLTTTQANAQSFGNHSGPIDNTGHSSVINAHSSDGNATSLSRSDQSMTGGDVAVSTNNRSRVLSAAAMPDFSPRGECGGSEGSAQAGTSGTFLGFSFGSTSNDPCNIRENIALLVEAGVLDPDTLHGLVLHAIPQMVGWQDMELVIEETENFRIKKFVRKRNRQDPSEWDPAFKRFRG